MVNANGSPCPWTTINSNAFISLVSGASDSGVRTVLRRQTPTWNSRSGVMTVAGQTFALTQSGGAGAPALTVLHAFSGLENCWGPLALCTADGFNFGGIATGWNSQSQGALFP